jgi:hypothetical protein
MPTNRYPELEDLLQQKTFDELSATERELVLSWCTEEEFRQFQRIVQAVSPEPGNARPPAMPNRLREAMQARSHMQLPLRQFISRPVPAWAAAVLVLAVSGIAFWRPLPTRIERLADIQYRVDTVFLTQMCYDTLYLPVPYRITERSKSEIAAPLISDTLSRMASLAVAAASNGLPTAAPDFSMPKISQGFSLHDDSVYLKLLSVVR